MMDSRSDSCSQKVPKCCLDEDNCLNLVSILQAFNAPINEEQSWAICYQTIKCIQAADHKHQLCPISHPKYLFIHKDGTVHEKSIKAKDADRPIASSLSAVLYSFGVTLYQALDYGLSEDEERNLDPNLELLIEYLTFDESNDGYKKIEEDKDTKDEGIERDSSEDENDHALRTDKIIEKVIEELRKSTKVVLNDEKSPENFSLDDLRVADWARLWMQVICELRKGVKLKKVDLNVDISNKVEYELTPFEMLLDDIRSRRYKLKKVMVGGDIPQRVKKDAHELILEFIRSRPPLVPVSRRKLPTLPPKQQTPYEKLMQSIREYKKLKPTPTSSLKQSSHDFGKIVK
ncbi:protein spire 1-like protein, partial [Dinothrombium tinctorium]